MTVRYRGLRSVATIHDLRCMQRRRGTEPWGSRMLLNLIRVVGLTLLGYAVVMFALQRRIAFPGALRSSPRATASAPAGVEQVWLDASFGRVEAWFFETTESGSAPTVVFAHGNGELIEDWQGEMRSLTAAGVNALLVEFPGYGFSDGKPTRATLRETFGDAFDWLVEHGHVDAERIVAYGRSIGGGAAADLARDRPVRALALQSTFSSATAIARELLVPGFLVRDRFDNSRAVAEFSGPVLLMHGPADDVIPYAHAERLARAREGLEITDIDCAHNDCASQWPTIVSSLAGFLRANGLFEGDSSSHG